MNSITTLQQLLTNVYYFYLYHVENKNNSQNIIFTFLQKQFLIPNDISYIDTNIILLLVFFMQML